MMGVFAVKLCALGKGRADCVLPAVAEVPTAQPRGAAEPRGTQQEGTTQLVLGFQGRRVGARV